MRKTDAFRRAAALMAALSITVSLAAPAFAGTYYIDYGDIIITKKDDGSQEIKQNGTIIENDDRGEIIITTVAAATTTLESDLEGPAAEDTGFGPVVEENYQPAQPEDAEEPKDADQPESAEEPKSADRQESAEEQESAGQQAQPQPQQAAPAPAAAYAPGFCDHIITVINNFADTVLNLTLKDVKIDVSDTGSYWVEGKAALSVQGKGNVEIELDGNNELKSGVQRAGLEKNTSTSTGTLTLKDDKEAGSGSLKATGGKYGAGIGGGEYYSGENITITGGRVNATGGWGSAGIGGGNYGRGNYGSGKNITIKGGTVTAKGGDCGAGIGGGNGGIGENIKITDGTVNATGGWGGAGIGGGDGGYGGYGNGKNITITDGTVTATGGIHGAGIGGGDSGIGEDITITGGTVNADGGDNGAGIGGGATGSGSNVTVSGAAQVTATTGKSDGYYGAGATIGNGGNMTDDGQPVDGEEIQADIRGVTTGYIHHIIYEQDGTTIKREWWEPERPQPNPESPQPTPEDPNAPAGESNEVSLGTPGLHVETLEGDLLPFDAQQQGSTLRVTSNTLAARLHGTRQALEALQEQGVEQIQFVTTLKTTTLSVEDLLAEGGSWFALEHDGLVSRRLSAAQAESLKCWMH
ncbi:MAG: hypothetical protein KHX18_03750 [Faecalibacterium prausnitzii]|nr:hypothetical protein [Faecalibacterium prausnitzii]